MRVVFVFAFGLLAAACGQNAHITLQPSDELSEATQEAIEVWAPTLESCGRSLSVGDRDVGGYIQYGDVGSLYALTSRGAPHYTDVNRELLESDHARLVDTLVHELGHVMGAQHTDNPEDIMFPTPSPQKLGVPSEADVAQVCEN